MCVWLGVSYIELYISSNIVKLQTLVGGYSLRDVIIGSRNHSMCIPCLFSKFCQNIQVFAGRKEPC